MRMPNPDTQHASFPYLYVRGHDDDDDDSPLSEAPAESPISALKQASPSHSLHSPEGIIERRSESSLSLPKVFLLNKVADASQSQNQHRIITSLALAGTGTNIIVSHAVDEEFCSATAANVNAPCLEEALLLQQLTFASINAEKGIHEIQTHSTQQPFTTARRISFGYFLASLGSIGGTSASKESLTDLHDQRSSVAVIPATSLDSSASGKSIQLESDFNKKPISGWYRKFRNFFVTLKTEATVFADGNEKQGTSSLNSITSTSSLREKDRKEQSTTPSIRVTPAPEIIEDVSISPENLNMKEERQLEFILKSLVAGGVSGMCAKTTVAPLDRIKILLQAHSKHYSHLGVFSGLRGVVEKERFLALYKGNGAQMVRIFPYAATQFTSFEMYKKLFGGEESHIGRFAAGSAAGVTAVALTYPLDTIRARLAFQITGEHVYNGIYSCAAHIFREEGGVRALYRGFIPTVCGMIPYAGLIYTCKSHSTNTGGLVLQLHAKLLCGGIAGAVAQTVAYPLDVTRRRMQLAMMDEKTKKFGMGMVPTLKLIYQENGVMRGLYRGMSNNYLRAIPMVAVSFSTYELVKQMLKLDTGLAIKTG